MRTAQPPETPQEIATRAQGQAADPAAQVWVTASAGSGKTKVLTDRVLRLLLPRGDGTPGSPPERIVCITFTKAAAAEMHARLSKILAAWALAPEETLTRSLTALLHMPPTPAQVTEARRLFSRVIDGPGQIHIQTIHAFCHSILARFPLEAGLPPGFTVLQPEQAARLMDLARKTVFQGTSHAPDLAASFTALSETRSETDLSALIARLLSRRRALTRALHATPATEREKTLARMLHLPPDLTKEKMEETLHHLPAEKIADLKHLAQGLAQGGKKDGQKAQSLASWLAAPPEKRLETWENLRAAFFTSTAGTRPANTPSKAACAADEGLEKLYHRLADWAEEVDDHLKALQTIADTAALLQVGEAVLRQYESLKQQRGSIDFDDLIIRTAGLLKGRIEGPRGPLPMVPWVLFKLDGGIDHILVDEAQDTNPDQWDIIETLVEEFYSGTGRTESGARTLFVVGDEKQSIYRFQQADLNAFRRSRRHLGTRAQESDQPPKNIELDVSFRSTAPILELVDATFAETETKRALGIPEGESLHHRPAREGQGGRVELWPLLRPPEEKEEEESVAPGWILPLTIRESTSPLQKLASRIAARLRSDLQQKRPLPAYERPMEPGDILILVRNRAPLAPLLLAALRREGVPVSGVDRLRLAQALPVQDLLAAARFALQPGDDLSLACLLKTPLVGWNDDDLLRLAPGRKGSLWDAVQQNPQDADVALWLQDVIDRAHAVPPFEFFAALLDTACPADPEGTGARAMESRLGKEAQDPLEELLEFALEVGTDPTRTLAHLIADLTRDDPEIKRELSEPGNVVRLMTIHGAKGLEAPIVILADTITPARNGNKGETIFWPEEAEGKTALPIWSPRKESRPKAVLPWCGALREEDQNEHRRLLYVALTRARDTLIVAGAWKSGAADESSWYFDIQRGMERLKDQPEVTQQETPDGPLWLFESQQIAAPDGKKSAAPQKADKAQEIPLSDHWRRPPPPEPTPPRPLQPSRPSAQEEVPAPSPLTAAQDPVQIRRGLVTHKLLQLLPRLPKETWDQAASALAARPDHDLPESQQKAVIKESLAVLSNPRFADVFGPGSLAEVPVTGLLPGGCLVSGQIDRLIVSPEKILIVDFKTDRAPPDTQDQVPEGYRRQLAAYRDLLRAIWPGRRVECALIWTQGARLMPVSDEFLDTSGA